MARRNLIITKAGRDSLHRRWLESGRRNFDILVFAYHPEAMGEDVDGISHAFLDTPKVVGWQRIFAERADLFDCYDRIALVDDDLAIDAATMNACFDIGKAEEFLIWQPALSWDSHITYAGLLRNPLLAWREVNFIEMMCPFFSAAYLRAVLPLFGLGFESGVDLIWCSMTEAPRGRFAVIDKLAVRHTRPVGELRHLNGFVDKTYEDDIHGCLKMFSASWPSLVASKAVSRNGARLDAQWRVTLAGLVYLLSVPFAPRGRKLHRMKRVLAHLRHQLVRKPSFIPCNAIFDALETIGLEKKSP